MMSPPDRFDAVLATPFGPFGIETDAAQILELVFLPRDVAARPPRNALSRHAAEQIEAWLGDPDRPFDLPLAARGTAFQRRAWAAISDIPRGRTATYGSIATRLGSAAQAVGQACAANPFPLIVPCHRVVAAAGPGGFAHARSGELISAKQWLLALEAAR